MSKKLKKKIEKICGLDGLDWEARQERANQILASPERKQALCNDLMGLTFRELERTLFAVASERQRKEDNYERKLEAYNSGRSNKEPKPLRGNSTQSTTTNGNRPPAAKPRTLAEILAQVYAPRVVPEQDNREAVKAWLHSFRSVESGDEIPSDSIDGNDNTK